MHAMRNVEWHEDKAASNYRKHGVRFSEAVTVFTDPLAITMIIAGNVGLVQTRPAVIIKEKPPEAMIMPDIEKKPINKPRSTDGHGLGG